MSKPSNSWPIVWRSLVGATTAHLVLALGNSLCSYHRRSDWVAPEAQPRCQRCLAAASRCGIKVPA